MTFVVLGRALELCTLWLLQTLHLQAASRHKPIAIDPEGLTVSRSLVHRE
jgi:hypothetical protein